MIKKIKKKVNLNEIMKNESIKNTQKKKLDKNSERICRGRRMKTSNKSHENHENPERVSCAPHCQGCPLTSAEEVKVTSGQIDVLHPRY